MRAGRSKIVQALLEARKESALEIRVHLSRRWFERDTLARARKLFNRFELSHPKRPRCILLYMNLRKKKFALFADETTHSKLGQQTFDQLARLLGQNLRSTHYENAIVELIHHIAALGKTHFPISR